MEDFFSWEEKYSVGVPQIDEEHKKLFRLLNTMHRSCLTPESIRESFKDAMHAAVNYVKVHFHDEESLLAAAGYPDLAEHKAQHAAFSKRVLDSVTQYKNGNPAFVAFDFVRFLRDWILSHILVSDQMWATWLRTHSGKTG